jgi:hypothetical protein
MAMWRRQKQRRWHWLADQSIAAAFAKYYYSPKTSLALQTP